jgi:hypothetical protein
MLADKLRAALAPTRPPAKDAVTPAAATSAPAAESTGEKDEG